jgi:hypothetical protein
MKYLLTTLSAFMWASTALAGASDKLGHPRLYFNSQELAHLRALRSEEGHAAIWKNIALSADWCLMQTPRKNWIAPVSRDPIYENLYDRFYAIMRDLAITEHLSFAYALSGDAKYGDAARTWVLASCRAWRHEADGEVNDGTAYAVSRLLMGIAVGYDLVYDRFSDVERKEIRDTLTRIGKLYFEKWFSLPTITAPEFCTHHAIVQWSSLGVVGLALLGETPDAQKWVDATTAKFERDILPRGLAPDGAQVEGATFWASTMHYRLFYMDPLRRVTGVNLFKKFAPQMNADLALASIAGERFGGYCQNDQDVVLEPYYGQLNYYSPVLTFLAREYRRPIYQYLAGWDHTLGEIQKTRAITPHGEQLLFEFGGYDFVWYDSTVPAKVSDAKLSYYFPSVDEAYVRRSWQPGDLLAAVSKRQLVVHAGEIPILMERGLSEPPKDSPIASFQDDGQTATIQCGNESNRLELQMNRSQGTLRIFKMSSGNWRWYTASSPVGDGATLTWEKNASLRVVKGEIAAIEPDGYAPLFRTGLNKLPMADPAPKQFTIVTIKPTAEHEIELAISRLKRGSK